MVSVDNAKCTGCGSCVDVCPQQAITMHDNLVMINEYLCIQCGTCVNVCPAGAIREVALANARLSKGGETMQYGYGRGFGRRGGIGFGFRGSSPPWPYFGRGRGGLPRCWYPGVAMASFYPLVPPAYAPQMPQEQELGFLQEQAEATKGQLGQIEARMRDLETEE